MAETRLARDLDGTELVAGVVVAGVIVALVSADRALALPWVFAALPFVLVAHEAAHAVVGLTVGRMPALVRIGGPGRVRTFRLGPTTVIIGWNPFGGGMTLS